MFKKYKRNGKIAVLISEGYGAGWYTWNTQYPEILFDVQIVDILLTYDIDEHFGDVQEKIKLICQLKYPDAYLGSVDGLRIHWIPEGTLFKVRDYDGGEHIEIFSEANGWFEA